MIQINLLDQSAGKARPAAPTNAAPGAIPRMGGSSLGGPLIGLVAVVMLVLNGGMFWLDYQKVHASGVAVDVAKAEQSKLKTEVGKKLGQAEQIRKYREVVSNQMDVLKSLDPSDRILWCEKINELANLMPPNVFLAEVKINEDVKMVETAQSKAAHEKWEKAANKDKLKEPPVVQKPVISYNVRLTGLALGKDNVEQMQNVTNFHKSLIEHVETDADGKQRRFMDGFNNNIEFESVEATTYEGTPVNKFIFKLTTKPMGEDKPEDTAAKQAKQVADGLPTSDAGHSRTVAANN